MYIEESYSPALIEEQREETTPYYSSTITNIPYLVYKAEFLK